jgi:hypothetical protein
MKKEDIKEGSVLVSTEGVKAFVIKVLKDKLLVRIDGHKAVILNNDLYLWEFANPIKDDRIISSKTFAVRFKQFLEWIPKEFYMSGPHILEEYEYMNDIANRLLNYQIQTASDKEEIDYLKRLNLL